MNASGVDGDVDLTRQTLERGRSGKNFTGHTSSQQCHGAICGRQTLNSAFDVGERGAEVGARKRSNTFET